MMRRSFLIQALFAPIQKKGMDLTRNESLKFYKAYLDRSKAVDQLLRPVCMTFNKFAHEFRMDKGVATKRRLATGQMIAVGTRFSYELLDIYISQVCTMFFPHKHQHDFLPLGDDAEILPCTQHFVGALNYLCQLHWTWAADSECVVRPLSANDIYSRSAFPGNLSESASAFAPGAPVFADVDATGGIKPSMGMAFRYFMDVCLTELETRARQGRRLTLMHRLNAVYQLTNYLDDPAFAPVRGVRLEEWSRVHVRSLVDRAWSPGQQRALDAIHEGLSCTDANMLMASRRMLFLSGEPGSGKSEVIVHAAARAAHAGLRVLILCPTGALVHSYRDRLPETDKVVVETIHSGFAIYRENDKDVEYAPPTRLRKYDLLLLDEGSQVEDGVARKMFMAILELPQKPFCVITADFQQLNPVAGGSVIRGICDGLPQVELKTIFRTNDDELKKFCRVVRNTQPAKSSIVDFSVLVNGWGVWRPLFREAWNWRRSMAKCSPGSVSLMQAQSA